MLGSAVDFLWGSLKYNLYYYPPFVSRDLHMMLSGWGTIANGLYLSISPVDRRSSGRAVRRVETSAEPSGLLREIDPEGTAIEKLSPEGRTGHDRGLLVEGIHERERAFHYDADYRGILSEELFQLLLGRALESKEWAGSIEMRSLEGCRY